MTAKSNWIEAPFFFWLMLRLQVRRFHAIAWSRGRGLRNLWCVSLGRQINNMSSDVSKWRAQVIARFVTARGVDFWLVQIERSADPTTCAALSKLRDGGMPMSMRCPPQIWTASINTGTNLSRAPNS